MIDPAPPEDPVVSELEEAIDLFVRVKRRYPFLMATSIELETIRDLPTKRRFANEPVLQILRDSFDMLVIDLYSIRQRLVKTDGLFHRLKQSPSRLHVRDSSIEKPDLKAIVQGQIREAAQWLTPGEQPTTTQAVTGLAIPAGRLATTESVTELCSRFVKETKPLDQDRNRVRAHRFEQKGRDTSALFIELPALKGQIDIVECYLENLNMVITHTRHSMELYSGNTKAFAEDLADLIIHGSVNDAVTYYASVKATPENPTPWYWYARQETLKRLGDRSAV